MKKIIIALAFTLTYGASFAQFNKGRMLVGGNLGFETNTSKSKSGGNTSDGAHSIEFTTTSQFGYFLIDNFAVGAGINLSLSSSSSNDNNYKANSTAIQFQPFVRYYIEPGIFFQGAYGIGSGKIKYDSNGNSYEDNYIPSSWSLAAGYAIFINDHVAIEPLLGCGSTYNKYKADGIKFINSGFFLRVGFQIYLGSRE